jgi:hypothetical protein
MIWQAQVSQCIKICLKHQSRNAFSKSLSIKRTVATATLLTTLSTSPTMMTDTDFAA